MNAGITNDYLILFTVKTCEVCDLIIEILEEAALYLNDRANLTFYKIDAEESIWAYLRFNFEKVPNIIYVSKGKYAIYPYDNLTKREIKNFIDDRNKVMIELPKNSNNIFIIFIPFILLSYKLEQTFSFWDVSYYWILMILFFFFIFIIEYKIIIICCSKSKRSKKYNKEHHHLHDKRQMKKRNKIKAN